MAIIAKCKLFKWIDDECVKFKYTSFSHMYNLAKVNENILFIPVYDNVKIDKQLLREFSKSLKH